MSASLFGEIPNRLDNLHVEVPALFAADYRETSPQWNSPFQRWYRSRLWPAGWRGKLWTAWHRTGLDQDWFDRAKVYWGRVLGGRPLWGPEDFHFLRNIYRQRFQTAAVAQDADAAGHLAAWQSPQILGHWFQSVYKEARFHWLPHLQWLRKYAPRARSILEFGCGVAPLATSLFDFRPDASRLRIFIADLETVSFHYATWKFGRFPNVIPHPLRAADQFALRLPEKTDAIFCLAVFEHLNAPLETVRQFHEALSPGGVLIFDYIVVDGTGMDTIHGLRERPAVLDFIEKNFRVVHGRLDPAASMGLTVAVRSS